MQFVPIGTVQGSPIFGAKDTIQSGPPCYAPSEDLLREHLQEDDPLLLDKIEQLRSSDLPHMERLGNTLHDLIEKIVCMWLYTCNNGVTEGSHNKMKMIVRRAYGFRNFENYRLRVKALCA